MKITAENRQQILNDLKTITVVYFSPYDKQYNVIIGKVTNETKSYYISKWNSSYDKNVENSFSFGCDRQFKKSLNKCLNKNVYYEVTEDNTETVVNNMKKLLIEQDFYSVNRINNSQIHIDIDINKTNLTSIN